MGKHANLISVLYFLQTIMSEVDNNIEKLENQKIKPRPRRKKYQLIEKEIINILNEYDVKFMLLNKFLRKKNWMLKINLMKYLVFWIDFLSNLIR